MLLFTIASCLKSFTQKKYGYAVLQFRCGNDDAQKDRVYYSPVIELNTLNFPQFTDQLDPSIALHSVRYYNFAISKWFEIFLKDKYGIPVNDPAKYARKSHAVIYNEGNKNACDDKKTNPDCFFINKDELLKKRKGEIMQSKGADNRKSFCEVLDL